MIFDDAAGSSAASCAAMPRATILPVVMPFMNEAVPSEVATCLGWLRFSVRVGVPMVLVLTAIAGLPSAWSARFPDAVSPGPMAAAACGALAAILFAAVPRVLDASGSQGVGRQAAMHSLVAAPAAAVLAAMLCGWMAAPAWAIVAGAALAWFGSILMALRELAASAARLGSSPDIVARLERRVRSGAGVWLVGLAAVAAVAATGMIAAWYGTDASGGREAATVHFGPAFALLRLVALALSGYACIGLACWAVVFEVMASGIAAGAHAWNPSSGSR